MGQHDRIVHQSMSPCPDERRMQPNECKAPLQPPLADMEPFFSQLVADSKHTILRAPVGMRNIGNTCYISAALQCLASLPPLIEYFHVKRYHETILTRKVRYAQLTSIAEATPDKGLITLAFAEVIQCLQSHIIPVAHPNELRELVMRLPNNAGSIFQGNKTHDAHEFMQILLGSLQQELNTAYLPTEQQAAEQQSDEHGNGGSSIDSGSTAGSGSATPDANSHWRTFQRQYNDVINHLLSAQVARHTVCSTCSGSSLRYETAAQITLTIPKGDLDPTSSTQQQLRSVTLQHCLEEQLSVDALDDYNCGHCGSKQPAKTGCYLPRLPPILILQLRRFETRQGPDGWHLLKDETRCIYPLELDMSAMLHPPPGMQPERPALASSARYRLRALICHYTSPAHYIAFARAQVQVRQSSPGCAGEGEEAATTDSSWYCFNDARVSTIDEQTVLSTWREVYVLFYQRAD